jgi:hypothetical protein
MTLQTIVAYQAKDGKQFFDLAESQTYARRQMHGGIYNAALKHDPNFAKLDKELVIDMLMLFGKHFAKVAQDPLEPAALDAKEPVVVVHQLHTGGPLPKTPAGDLYPATLPRHPEAPDWTKDFRRGGDPLVAARNVSRAEEEAAKVLERELANGVA